MALRSFVKAREGTSAIEFAFTAPIFMLLVWATIDAGLALWTQFGLENGVESAARCAQVNSTVCPDGPSITAYAASNTLGMTVPKSVFTFVIASCGDRVSASYPYTFFSNYLGAPSVTLSASSCYPDPRRNASMN